MHSWMIGVPGPFGVMGHIGAQAVVLDELFDNGHHRAIRKSRSARSRGILITEHCKSGRKFAPWPPAGPYSRVLSVPRLAHAIRPARTWVRETLVTWDVGALAEPGALIASELATNAVVHAQTASRVVLLLMYAAGTVRLEVRDDDPVNLPVRRNPAYSGTGGRGLVVVEALSQRWGVRVIDSGKSVWAELDITPPGTGSEL